jgi:maleamate amidohydrolase
MTDLENDYRQAGFSSRLGFGVAPALLVVDAVRAYTDPDSPLYLKSGEAALDAMAQLLEAARRHSLPIAYTTIVLEAPEGRDAPLFFRKVPALRLFAQGSPFGEIPEKIAPREAEPVFKKKYASAFFGTTLSSWLSHERADTVLVSGFSTSGCVRASALDALQHGFRPIVVRDAVADRDRAPHEANLFDLDAKYADVVTLDDALEYINTR